MTRTSNPILVLFPHRNRTRHKVVYDGQCHFCVLSVRRLAALDHFGRIELVDFRPLKDPGILDKRLTLELCHSELQLLTTKGRLYGGFYAFRRLTLALPALYPFAPVFYFPGVSYLGRWAYKWIAKNRHLLHRFISCKDDQCYR